jgi:hypothetical protein
VAEVARVHLDEPAGVQESTVDSPTKSGSM